MNQMIQFPRRLFAVLSMRSARIEPREAYGVRGACSRFWTDRRASTAPASWTHSIRFALKVALLLFLASSPPLPAADATPAPGNPPLIRITTAHSTLTLSVGDDGRIYQVGYGSSDARLVLTNRP